MQGGRSHWALCLVLGIAVGAGASGCGESHASGADAGTAGDATGGEGASCEVGGVVYDDGDTDIDDPFSCNTCVCEDGVLACTEIDCPEPCPEGTAPGTSCSRCGPTDACEVVRTDCHPTCESEAECVDTDLPFCSTDGVCTMLCG
jgi:hypothetical protein